MITSVPMEIFEEHVAVLAKTGAGKTFFSRGVAERLLAEGHRVGIIDPTDAQYGIRLDPSGTKPSGADVVIFGGPHADIPISGRDGAAIAEAIGTTATSAIICTRGMTVEARTGFMTDFATALLAKNRGRLHLILDEAHLFSPKGKVISVNAGKMIAAVNDLVTGGRLAGIRIVMMTQRSAKLHNDCLSQAATLIAMKMVLPADREAVRDWIKDNADLDKGKEILSSLAQMPVGHGWLWSPGIDILDRLKVPPIKTFDSMRPREGRDLGPELIPLDLDALKASLGKIAEDAKANDPKTLKARVAELERALKAAETSAKDLDEAFRGGYADGHRDGHKVGFAAALKVARERVTEIIDAFPLWAEERMCIPPMDHPAEAAPKHIPPMEPRVPAPRRAPGTVAGDCGNGSLSGPQRTMLGALAWWQAIGESEPTRAQVAAICGWRPNAGHLSNVAGQLSTQGLITYPTPGRIALTAAGERAAPAPPDGSAYDLVAGVLNGPQRKALDYLLAVKETSAAKLAEGCGWEPQAGHVSNVLGSLSSMKLIERPTKGVVRAVEWLR